jgi:hypothetical protein
MHVVVNPFFMLDLSPNVHETIHLMMYFIIISSKTR